MNSSLLLSLIFGFFFFASGKQSGRIVILQKLATTKLSRLLLLNLKINRALNRSSATICWISSCCNFTAFLNYCSTAITGKLGALHHSLLYRVIHRRVTKYVIIGRNQRFVLVASANGWRILHHILLLSQLFFDSTTTFSALFATQHGIVI